MTKSKCFLFLIIYFSFLEAAIGNPFGEISNDVNKNVSDNIGTAGMKWDPLKLLDIFKPSNSVISVNNGLNVKTNPFGIIFKRKNGSKLQNATNKFRLPFLQKKPHFPPYSSWNQTMLPNIFKGFNNLESINSSFKMNPNDVLQYLTDIFKPFKSINAVENFNFTGFDNLEGLTMKADFTNSFWKVLHCVMDFTKSLKLNLKPIQNYLKGFQGLTIPQNLLDTLKKNIGDLKIDTNLLNEVAKWINNFNAGIQIDPMKIEEILGGMEGLAKIDEFLAPYIETIAAGLGAIDALTLPEIIEGILALLLIL